MAMCINESNTYDSSDNDEGDGEAEPEAYENFNNLTSSTCWVCNGYYGSNFGEPMCGTCHSFLFAPYECTAPENTCVSDEEDSGNDEPLFEDRDRQDREDQDNIAEPGEGSSRLTKFHNNFNSVPKPSAVRTLSHYIDVLSQSFAGSKSNKSISDLPVEVLLSIFSYLDDLTLWNVSEVCKQWRQILETHTPQQMWKKYTKERWPLFQEIVHITNWFKLYGALMSSCFCRTCLINMAVKPPLMGTNHFRATRLRGDIRSLDTDSSEGIVARPLDHQYAHWQASIMGPDGSPYEGGKFFLYIVIPLHYPMDPPIIRFLTKIIHPNVSRHGDVGIDIIQHNWSLALTISKLLLSVQSLLTDPFTEICMEPELGRMYEHERSKFEKLARHCTWKYATLELMTPN